jgi:hypothetical protein
MALNASKVSPQKARPPDGHAAPPSQEQRQAMSGLGEAIARRAYEKFLARGSVHGFDQQDWEDANRELMAEAVAD